jgi:hypothetical protein
VLISVLAMSLSGCGEGATDPSSSSAGSPAETADAEPVVPQQSDPDAMPDRVTDPVEFLRWRVDRLFEDKDLDTDGRLTAAEFGGEAINFERIDTDGDGVVTKQEIIDDRTQMLRDQGTIP